MNFKALLRKWSNYPLVFIKISTNHQIQLISEKHNSVYVGECLKASQLLVTNSKRLWVWDYVSKIKYSIEPYKLIAFYNGLLNYGVHITEKPNIGAFLRQNLNPEKRL